MKTEQGSRRAEERQRHRDGLDGLCGDDTTRGQQQARKQGGTHVDEVVGVSSALRPCKEDRRVDLPHGFVDLVEALRVALRTRAVPARRNIGRQDPTGKSFEAADKFETEKMQGKGCAHSFSLSTLRPVQL